MMIIPTTIGEATAALPSLSTGTHSSVAGTNSHSHPSDADSHLIKHIVGAGVGHIQLGPFKAAPSAILTFEMSITHSVISRDIEEDVEDRNSPNHQDDTCGHGHPAMAACR
ncbi:hypothetical protein AMATHDRAFT_6217 [Amanita thiersii Skay4041]|uniref:Uncharacterized protein n=1 Tax=Amanita thiersii Skay4041 TaxID=703135 RepID=A0A2A9NF93_9AGAR|nr:hypothetical protein AMATHDRAFT_6217 [Amanita thiersii Skay4041]